MKFPLYISRQEIPIYLYILPLPSLPRIMKAYLLDLIPLSKIKYSKLQIPSFRKQRARRALMTRGPFTIMFIYVSAVPWLMDSTVIALKKFPFSQFKIAFQLHPPPCLQIFSQKKCQHNLMFFWPCIMNWLYVNYQLDALIIIYS